MGVCVSDVALSPLHARLVDCQRVNSAGNRVGYLSSLGYPGILGYLGTLGYCRVLASLVHSAYWLHMKLMRDRSTYEFLAINSQHSAQKSVLKMFIILTGMQCVCVCFTSAPLRRWAVAPFALGTRQLLAVPVPAYPPCSPNRVQCPQGVVSEGVSITYCGRRAAGETCVVFSMNFHTHTHTVYTYSHTRRQIDSHILSRNALITMAHKITIYLSITNLPPTRSSFYVSASLSSVNSTVPSALLSCSQCLMPSSLC